jgi:hypothetical protein
MEVRNIHSHAGWYASFMNGQEQGEALVMCQANKIKQLSELIETIKMEIGLTENPKEYDERVVLDSISALINQHENEECEYTKGFFKWIG